ncbi:diguanylate cyclase [Massilia glaciei]|uniref:diguanylate cyclase n=1 Tax=Massilia glaciei TaxID=1524097 RepID=A0A2U2HF22_9BURK|nr:diguanylate cyclase [Massilia glaciei]PWF42663.1 GGDEF domain-containing protein [Massilia glaciei]
MPTTPDKPPAGAPHPAGAGKPAHHPGGAAKPAHGAAGAAKPAQNAADIAREAFRLLAANKIAPTPQAYTAIYNGIAGIPVPPAPGTGPERVLAEFAGRLAEAPGELAATGRRLQGVVAAREWDQCGRGLASVAAALRKARPEPLLSAEGVQEKLLRELLGRALGFALVSLLADAPTLMREAASLGAAVKLAHGDAALAEIGARLKQLCYQIEIQGGDAAERQEGLLRLFKLLLENVGELLEDDSWLKGQVAAVQGLISGPIDERALEDATRSLKEVVFKQGQLKHTLSDVRGTVKNMMLTFVDSLGSVAASTADYHARIAGFTEQIKGARDIGELSGVLAEVLRATRSVQQEALAARDQMVAARNEVQLAEQRVAELEEKLRHLSELVREDQLTGSLNRRGLDDVLGREGARAERRGTPLCVALLDLDDFKRINDDFGRGAGDGALKHLVRVIKDTLRTLDVVARIAGEEFVIVLPETTLEAAAQTMTRLQRELTRHFFLHEQEKVFITFSAGVALRRPGEGQESLLKRADQAMLEAQRSGKNQVVVA